ncbi:GTP cyclohydrolase II [candidate division KSB1 bacterium RBG_16_48_16]|nr:MAG: GTP cyclohydrolase II [candidate division KSB1 bacterium RBG_16_48_16]
MNLELEQVHPKECARIPTDDGTFQLYLYESGLDGKEHLALVMGDVEGRENVLVRVHSECFTGDVLGSKRCDCGDQLHAAMAKIAQAGRGVILYLRQEGRGIGLKKKLKAYNLQDLGYDTVDANIMLGHQADERDYTIAAHILRNLDVRSVRLLTNNPEKINSLNGLGIPVLQRLPLYGAMTPENSRYLITKIERMKHLLDLDDLAVSGGRTRSGNHRTRLVDGWLSLFGHDENNPSRPAITLAYAQSVDGSIASRSKKQMRLSGEEALVLTHKLRASHDAILIGIETVLADNPQLTVRLAEGRNPQPVILDTRLRMPPDVLLMQRDRQLPWIFTGKNASARKARLLVKTGARVVRCDTLDNGMIDLNELMQKLKEMGIGSLMVEGGSKVISSFIDVRLVDRFVITVSPRLIGGLPALESRGFNGPLSLPFREVKYRQYGDDLVMWAKPQWNGE